ncbi:site-specific DNA-methyltransferase [Algoriphagus sp. PAP.12]|uniref:site-specific DNA-methyltransferase n=1 Tax=Algoriphagus sp. PAP.12 TaxID=2996678 RepID=UPI00227CE667|nr:site-specific DNA-methyltransferase [Algoriphagus sp. PAP.12]
MPTLHWIGKEKVINHHLDVPFKVLEHSYGFDNGTQTRTETQSGNKIIHGDNLEALKALLPEYEGQIKCIYIDPPYNTGEEKWIYNDNVNDPKLIKWLGDVVGKEADDLTRHDKWLCMIYPRLQLLNKLLHPQGSIWISIDDNEQSSLKLVCDEVFGRGQFVAANVWQKRYSRENREAIGDVHEYIYVYAKDQKFFKENRNLIPGNEKQLKVYRNPNNDPKGRWRPIPMTAQAGHATSEQFYPIETPTGAIHYPPQGRCWGIAEKTYKELLSQGRIYFGLDGSSQPNIIRYLSEVEGFVPWTWWNHEEVGHTDEAKKEIYNILSKSVDFDTPKPLRLIERILRIATSRDDLILDSFAGSGTTAQAVFNLNQEDNGNRKVILVEMLEYAEGITAERLRRTISGYEYDGSKKDVLFSKKLNFNTIKKGGELARDIDLLKESNKANYDKFSVKIEEGEIILYGESKKKVVVEGTGGSFDFYELGQPLFGEDGNLNESVGLPKIRNYVWYTETKTSLKEGKHVDNAHFLGNHVNTSYYFYYESEAITTLDHSFLASIKTKAEQYVIYADNCLLTKEFMVKHHIIFKKIPRDITRF